MPLETSKVLTDLNTIFRDVLDNESITLTELSSANDVPDWDSVNHLILLHAVQEHYRIKFELAEIIGFRTIGDICNSIRDKYVQ